MNPSPDRLPALAPLSFGEGISLRALEESDAEELHALIEANRAHLARWLPWAAAQAIEDTRGFIRRLAEQEARDDGFQLALVLDERIAGMVGYRGIDWDNRATSLGYWLAEVRQGRGVMTAAVRALTEHAFSAAKLHRVEIRTADANRRSRAIPERLGFAREGILREAELVGGRYLDVVVYATLAPDRHLAEKR